MIQVLKIYHPFINGPNGDYVKQMQMEYPDVRINIPPLSVMKDELSVAGEKEGVEKIADKIRKIAKEMVSTTRTRSLICSEYIILANFKTRINHMFYP